MLIRSIGYDDTEKRTSGIGDTEKRTIVQQRSEHVASQPEASSCRLLC